MDGLLQRWPCHDGTTYVFNHFTAEHGLANQSADEAPPPPPPLPSPPPLASALVASSANSQEARLPPRSTEPAVRPPAVARANAAVANPAGYVLVCSACCREMPCEAFDKKQQKYSLTSRTCKECIEKADEEALWTMCITCLQRKHVDSFRKKTDWERPTCVPCLEQLEEEQSMTECTLCRRRQDRRAFRNKADWERPVCRGCLDEREEQERQDWEQQKEEEALQRQRERDEMTDRELRQAFERLKLRTSILGGGSRRHHACTLPTKRPPMRSKASKIREMNWCKCRQWIGSDRSWRESTPSFATWRPS
mmetsp:Transcript_158911/g.509695  ORF Transcript_158911/g.509695 Transcript_158911/m.509695 type:complete len:309 (-) Transcript_158911:940-1866(-)